MMSSRLRKLILTIVLGIVFMSTALLFAQDTGTKTLMPGITTPGTLNTTMVAQVYTISASTGQTVSVTATNNAGARLALLVTDSTGTQLGQVIATAANANVALENVAIPTSGTYFVTVVDAGGVPVGDVAFEITLQLGTAGAEGTAEATTAAQQLLTATGLQFKLAWDTVANLDLEVRDPVGGSLFWETPTVASGGKFTANANGACNALSQTPSEEGSWPAGAVPAGSYEMIVYFQQQTDCPNSNPANLTLTVTLDSKQVSQVKATIQPNQTYLASVVINADGTVAAGANGVKVDPPTVAGIDLKTGAKALAQNTPATGTITSKAPYQIYSFAAQAGDVVTAQLDSNSGSLDTLLLLVDPSGNIVASNDDRAQGVTDSTIQNFSVIVAGTYSLVVTRYGQALGGTEGGYTLTLTGAVTATATGTQTANVQVPTFANVPPGSVEVSLQWSTAADIQLLVRDPQGDSVYDDKPTIPSGGTLAANGNNNCVASNGTSPVSYIYWPEGRLPTAGAYEIEVLYQSNCNDTRPVQFVLTVVANGKVVLQKNELLNADQRYVISYTIGLDGQVTAGEGGIFGTKQKPDAASLLTAVVAEMPSAPTLTVATPATGSIRTNNTFDVYAFDGKAGQVATIGMEKLNGTLDPVLFLIGPGGDQVTQNDDAGKDTNNSLISNYILPVDGKYTVIATHFGGTYGVTAGDYRLTLRLN